MDNPKFIDQETIPLVQDEDHDDCNTPNNSRVDETSFTEPDTTKATSTLRLSQKVKWDKITALYRHLNVKDYPGLDDTNRLMKKTKKSQKQAALDCFFSMEINIGNPLLINVLVIF